MSLQTRLFLLLALIFMSLMGIAIYSVHYLLSSADEYWLGKFTQKQMTLTRDIILQPVWQSLQLAQKMAQEPALRDMAEQPNNRAIEQRGIQVLEKYRGLFDSHSYFAALRNGEHYYFNDAQNNYAQQQLRYTLSQHNQADQWFYQTLQLAHPYAINVEHNAKLNTTNVWINVLLKHDKQVLGVVGTGITLNNFVQQVQTLKQEGVLSVFVNADMAIQLADDAGLIDFASITKGQPEKNTIERIFNRATLEKINQALAQVRQNSDHKTVLSIDFQGKPHFLGILYLPELDWYQLTLLESESGLSGLQIALITTVSLMLFLIAFLLLAWMLRRRILHPLAALQQQLKASDNPVALLPALPKGAAQEVQLLATQLMQMTQQRNQYEQRLQTTVHERTADLEIARNHAEQALRTKSLFLANMSHEIRTPMNAIMGMLHLTLQTELQAQQSDYLGKAEQAAQNLLSILNDILDFSKIEAGKLTLLQQDFSLEQIVSQSLSLFTPHAQQKNLKLILDIQDPTLLGMHHNCQGDPLRLMQILNNLLDNAIKFTAQGQIKLSIASSATAGLRFTVADTGIGIPTEQHAKLFQEFTQIDESSTRSYGGTGLGLAISKQLVERMNGRIWIENNAGRGTRFIFTAQLHCTPSPPARLCPTPLRILLINENSDSHLAELLCHLNLSDREHIVLCDTATALNRLQNNGAPPFDWLLCNESAAQALCTTLQQLPNPPYCILLCPTSQPSQTPCFDAPLFMPILPDSLRQLWQGYSGQNRDATTPLPHRQSLLGLRVLLVEDHAINQEITQRMLEQQGAQVVITNNGLQALQRLNEADAAHFNVVLMDIHMPVLDGIATTQQIRAQARFAHLPIIAITASAMPDEQQHYLAVGMNGYICKPFTAQLLYSTLVQYLPTASPAPAANNDLSDAVYEKLRTRFMQEFGDSSAQLERLILAQQWQEAQSFVHNLKGVSGLLALQEIYGLAAALETHCKNQHHDANLLNQLKQQLALIVPTSH